MTLPVLRRRAGEEFTRALWAKARASPTGGPACPGCTSVTRAVPVQDFEVDVCTNCHCVWLDRHEAEELPRVPVAEALAADPAATVTPRVWASAGLTDLGPLEHATLTEVLGIADEDQPRPFAQLPWLTWGVAAAIGAASLALGLGDREAIETWGVTAEAWPGEPWRLLTAAFVHDGSFVLAGILVMLLLTGDNLERSLGRARYAVLLAAGTVAGNVVAAWLARDATAPLGNATALLGTVLAAWVTGWPRAWVGHHPEERRPQAALIMGLPFVAVGLWAMFVFARRLRGRRGMLSADNPLHASHASLTAMLVGVLVGLALAWIWLKPGLAEPAPPTTTAGGAR